MKEFNTCLTFEKKDCLYLGFKFLTTKTEVARLPM